MGLKLINLTSKDLSSLEPFYLSGMVTAQEGKLYIYKDKVIKIFNDQSKHNLKRKIHTVALLNEHKKEINVPELIIPESVAVIDGVPSGVASNFINGTNTTILLQSKQIPLEIKIRILKQIGDIIRKIGKNEKTLGLALGDLHEGNFVFDGLRTFAFDADSMKILDNHASPSKFLRANPNIQMFEEKYPYNVYGVNLPSHETDLFSFIMIILNVISKGETYKLPLHEYFAYLNYLAALGVDANLIDSFASVYTNEPSLDPTKHLDALKDIPKKATLKAFKASINR